MRIRIKKSLALFMCVVMMVASVPLSGFIGVQLPDFSGVFDTVASAASDDSGSCGTDVTYVFDSASGALTISGTGAMTSRPWYTYSESIISVVIEYGVTTIRLSAFDGCENLESIEIPSSVTSIGESAFYSCASLTSIDIPSGVTSIGGGAFDGCESLTSIDIPDGVTSIGYEMFFSCTSLESVELPSSLTSIKDDAFYGCTSLTSITIPDGVESIGSCAFESCSNLTSINIPNGIEIINSYAFYGCSKLTSINIPDSVTSIEDSAFRKCSSVTTVTITNSVQSIGSNAFKDCSNLTTVYFEGSPSEWNSINISSGNTTLTAAEIICSEEDEIIPSTDIASGACGDNLTWVLDEDYVLTISGYGEMTSCQWDSYNASIKSVVIEDGATSIIEYAFKDCTSLTSIETPTSVTSIGNYAFSYCKNLTNVEILGEVTIISIGMFNCCTNLENIKLPDSVTSIESYVFYNCENLTSITIPEDVTSIEKYAFFGCENLTSITIPEDVTSIEKYTFFGCENLTSITIPEDVTSIGESAFDSCLSLTSINIPDSVTTIGQYAFYDCKNLAIIEVDADNQYYSSVDGVLFNKDQTTLIQYAIGKEETSYVILDGVTTIGDSAFYNSSLTSVTIPTSIETIIACAFFECLTLETVYYNGTQDEWDAITIEVGNTYLTDATIEYVVEEPESTDIASGTCGAALTWVLDENYVLTISGEGDMYDFKWNTLASWNDYNSEITSVVIESGVSYIGSYAFYECTDLTSITIPDSVTSIGNHTFYACTSLTSIDVCVDNEYYSSVDGVLFNKDQTTLFVYPSGKEGTEYTIPDGVTTIDDIAFCLSKLTSVIIPDSVEIIGGWAFSDCTNLASIEIPSGVTSINYGAFMNCGNLVSIKISDTVTIIEDDVFVFCYNLTSIDVSDDNEYYSSIDGVLFNKDQTTLIKYALGKEDTSYTIPDGVTSIAEESFDECFNLTSIIIPDSVTSIENYAFYNCTNLTSVTIPNSVISIESSAFDFCENIETVYYYGTEEEWNAIDIGYYNTYLTGATIVYEYDPCADGHTCEAEITPPTCIDKGYTTYTCSVCKDYFYVDDYVDETGICVDEDGDNLCDVCSAIIDPCIDGHTYTAEITPPTCIDKGYTTYTCSVCETFYVDDYVNATGICVDENEDGKCDTCGESMSSEQDQDPEVDPDDETGSHLDDCDCACHSSGFDKFWFNFLNFFRKIFGMTQYQVCDCGDYHW